MKSRCFGSGSSCGYAFGAKPYRSLFRASWFGKVGHRELLGNRVLIQKQPQGTTDEPAQRAFVCSRKHTEAPVVVGLEADGQAMLFHRSSPVLCKLHQAEYTPSPPSGNPMIRTAQRAGPRPRRRATWSLGYPIQTIDVGPDVTPKLASPIPSSVRHPIPGSVPPTRPDRAIAPVS